MLCPLFQPILCVCEGEAKVLLCVLDQLWACVLWDFPGAAPLVLLGCQHIHVSQPGSQESRTMAWAQEQQHLTAVVLK